MARTRAWADTIFVGGAISDKNTVVTNLLADALTNDTLTAVRIIVDLYIDHGVDETADLSNALHVGIGVCSVEAFGIGVTALLRPNTQADYPPRGWLYVASARVLQHIGTGADADRSGARFQADLRSMRKIDKGILFLAVSQTAIFGAANVDLWGRVRVLCLT